MNTDELTKLPAEAEEAHDNVERLTEMVEKLRAERDKLRAEVDARDACWRPWRRRPIRCARNATASSRGFRLAR